ncbi:MAG TPA: hypothetical protein VHO70_19765 [Chitinispirillaceae bacterium]|nr:hypothetical protein [Chitinispirillaceae bacterium]
MKKVLTGLAFSAFLFLNQCSNVSEPLSSSGTDNVNGLTETTGTIEDTGSIAPHVPNDSLAPRVPRDTIAPRDTIIPEQYQIQTKKMSFKLSPSDTQVIDFPDYDSIYFRVSGNWCIKESLCTDAYGFFLDSTYSRTDLISDIFPAGILLGNIGRGTIMVNDYSLVDTRLLEKHSIVLSCNRFKNGNKNSESGFINVDVFLSKHVKIDQ